MDTAVEKTVLRKRALAARERGGDAAALDEHLRAALAPHAGRTLSGYWPMRNEPDPRPAMAAHTGAVCLPVVPGKGVPLVFRLWRGETLIPGVFGTMHPPDSCPEVTPEILIVPLLAFDSAFTRLGYGGGFYDRTLEKLRANAPVVALGLAWAVQEMPWVPADHLDQPLDMIVTDCGIRTPGAAHPSA